MSLDQKLIGSLGHLVTIGVDGEEGYQKAAEMVSNKNLLAQFEQLSTARNIQAEAIRNYMSDHGVEKPAHEGGFGGTLHRAWLDVKGTLSNRSDSVSISSCLTGDEAAVKAYQEVLDEPNLPADLQKLLTEHLQDLKTDVQNLEIAAKES
ncbi:PA2169 family four-helix-bundle protein [Mucilaginibacter sp.]|uniref:PA2169 family four-helix-bundle protein n=1 Tax=Mucilaginibacter sp. TaxID=1882438 RepID=UPI003AFFD9BC